MNGKTKQGDGGDICLSCGKPKQNKRWKSCETCRRVWRNAKYNPLSDARRAAWEWMCQWGAELGAMAEGTPHLITIKKALLGKDAE